MARTRILQRVVDHRQRRHSRAHQRSAGQRSFRRVRSAEAVRDCRAGCQPVLRVLLSGDPATAKGPLRPRRRGPTLTSFDCSSQNGSINQRCTFYQPAAAPTRDGQPAQSGPRDRKPPRSADEARRRRSQPGDTTSNRNAPSATRHDPGHDPAPATKLTALQLISSWCASISNDADDAADVSCSVSCRCAVAGELARPGTCRVLTRTFETHASPRRSARRANDSILASFHVTAAGCASPSSRRPLRCSSFA